MSGKVSPARGHGRGGPASDQSSQPTTPIGASDGDGPDPKATLRSRRTRARKVAARLAVAYPHAHVLLNFTSPLELTVATVLAAQSTDRTVNGVTPALFAKYPSAQAYAAADVADLERMLHATRFFRAKAAKLIELGQVLTTRFDGEIPNNLADLVSLPGVGRKTANVVLGVAFGVPAIGVDTHVHRLANRLGWAASEKADKIEAEMQVLLPKAAWTETSLRLSMHGRRVCHARRPACGVCEVKQWCPSSQTGETDPVLAARLVRPE